jgi:dihydrolipoamide dehydrogenase
VIGVDEHTGEPDDAFLMPWVQSHRIALVRGRERLTGERRVTVGDEELEARKAVILSGGSEPLLPPIDGLEDVEGVWTNREALTTREIPRRMIIVGAGPVGLELAQAFQKLGSQVTLIEGEPRVLPNHEEFARVQLTTALGQDGVEILTGRRVVRLGRNGDAYVVTTSDDGAAEADRVLVAVGRKAPTDDIGLQNVGLNPGGSSRSTSTCACEACRGCTRPATSAAGRSSRIWANTRRGSPSTTSSAMRPRSPTAPMARRRRT